MKKIIILIIISFLLTGCNYLELNKLAVVSGLGIDYKDGLFEILYTFGKQPASLLGTGRQDCLCPSNQ